MKRTNSALDFPNMDLHHLYPKQPYFKITLLLKFCLTFKFMMITSFYKQKFVAH